ncbi:MAG: AAA family ATPase [Bacillales bacterium]|jgi:AAA+ ATPase superfamily predicted ATPase|nr:AAA family ATPase [Bacillales bacterium]
MIIGREKEQHALKLSYESNRSEFVIVHGRRRVGKTHLIREFFNYDFFFYCTTADTDTTEMQYIKFSRALDIEHNIKDWVEGFSLLEKKIINSPNQKKKVIFIDEIPWFCEKSKYFISFFDDFWNRFASSRKDILLIVAGSAGNFIIDEFINATGSLYNRKTRSILLNPFSLKECAELLISNNIKCEKQEVLEAYMTFGGIPFYLNLFDRGLSITQNIDLLFFDTNASLKNEYDILFKSLFKNSKVYTQIIELLGENSTGLTREEIIKKLKISDSGAISKYLSSLVACGFIQNYTNFLFKKNKVIFQLTDNFCYFYIKIIKGNIINDHNYWANFRNKPKYNTWKGYAFERVCYNHLDQIKNKLGILGVSSCYANWKVNEAQIDLLIDRKDDIIDLIEIKFCNKDYVLDKEEYDNINNKIETFKAYSKTKKTVHSVLISNNNIKDNSYSHIIDKVITLADLFKF